VQRLLDARSSLSQGSVLRIKTGASALLSHAIRLGFIDGANVAREARAEGKRTDADTYAYNLDEVLLMLERVSEPAHTVIAVAAFAGLRSRRYADSNGRTTTGTSSTFGGRSGAPTSVTQRLRKVRTLSPSLNLCARFSTPIGKRTETTSGFLLAKRWGDRSTSTT